MNNFIPVFEPLLDGNEKKYLNECIESAWLGSNGPFVKMLENDFAKYCNQQYGSCVTNGSAALDVTFRAMKDLYKWELSFTKEPIEMLPESGKVLRVLDHNTMLLEMSQSPVLTQGKTLEDYKFLFVVKGTKGGFVDGKYRVGVKSFEGYAGSLLGSNTMIVEVPAYDLIENKLEGTECSIICISQ